MLCITLLENLLNAQAKLPLPTSKTKFQIAFWPTILQLKCFMHVFIVGAPKHTVKSGHWQRFPFHRSELTLDLGVCRMSQETFKNLCCDILELFDIRLAYTPSPPKSCILIFLLTTEQQTLYESSCTASARWKQCGFEEMKRGNHQSDC